MADYAEILDTQIEPDAPLTAVLAAQWRDNPLAMFRGASNAPRLATKTARGESSGNLTFSGLGQFQGLWFWGRFTSSQSANVTVTVSNNASGETFYGSGAIATIVGSGDVYVFGFIDFASGVVKRSFGTDTTIAGASNAIQRVRFVSSLSGSFQCMVWANGGESVT